VATNLAVGLARAHRHSTVLVDLDVQFGDVASALNLNPEYSLPDTLHGPASRDTMVLKTFLTLHETGLYVICGPKSPAEADSITAQQVSHLLQMLASEFEYVVVDTAPGLSEHVLAAMDASSDMVFVTSMDVPGLRGLRKELDALTELGMLSDSRCVVLNFTDSRSGLSVADAQATIGSPIHVLLPRSKATPRSVNQGVPLLQSGVRDPMTKELRGLVGRFAPTTVKVTKSARAKGSRKPAVILIPDAQPRRAASRWSRIRKSVA
jgi:pilus assembly protein CpaE